MGDDAAKSRGSRRNKLVIAGAGLAGLLLAFAWMRTREADDRSAPRFRGAAAGTAHQRRDPPAAIEFAGIHVCAECHPEQYGSYAQTAHSRAFSEVRPAQEPADAAFHHELSGHDFEVLRRNGELRHRDLLRDGAGETLAQSDHPLKWLVGSGRHSRTYLIETDGFLAESPITWYASRQEWFLSPGYDRPQPGGFERPADWGCLACHMGRAEAVEGAYHRLNILETAIGCERCHGAGAAHVARRRNGADASAPDDDPIVHPAMLTRDRQEDICAQCHLRGEATVMLRGRGIDDFHPACGWPMSVSTTASQRRGTR
jgi:hypothetical protein